MSGTVTISGANIIKNGLRLLNVTIEAPWDKVAKHVPIVISRVWVNIFQTQGMRFGRAWKQPSVWTKLLRAKGSRKKFTSLDEAQAYYMSALINYGFLRMSFTPSNGHSHYGFGNKMVFGGSKLEKARSLNDGGYTSPFTWTREKESRLKQNLAETLPGSKSKTTPTGRKSRAKKNWNPEYFITRNEMIQAGKEGRQFKMPARRIEPNEHELTTEERHNIAKALEAGISEAARGAGL